MTKGDVVQHKVVSVPTAAVMLGVGRNFAYELCRTNRLPHIRLGRRIVIPKVAIERLLAECSGQGIGDSDGDSEALSSHINNRR